MYKTLLKKQLAEILSGYSINRKTGKKRSPAATGGLVLLIIFVFISVAFAFYGMGLLLANAFVKQGIAWLYFAVMGIIAVFVGVICDMFSAYTTLYGAKDNDLLLSMPIKPSVILLSRMSSLFIMGFIFESVVFIPALLSFLTVSSLSAGGVVLYIFSTLLIGVTVTSLSCIFGYIIALIGSLLKNKAVISAFSTVLILGVYYVCYFKMNDILNGIANNAAAVSSTVKTYLYPMYCMGRGCMGEAVPFLIFAVITLVVLVAVCAVLSRSFIKISTQKTDLKALRDAKKTIKKQSSDTALLKKEFKHFTSSAAYMMNCGIGLAIILFAAVMLVVKSGDINAALQEVKVQAPFVNALFPVLMGAAAMLASSVAAITAPSISLEGNNLWILRSLPICAQKILYAKLKMHLILTEIPITVFALTAAFVFKFSVIDSAILLVTLWMALAVSGYLGLIFNLKHPKLEWTNETVPVKQSISVLFTMLVGWGTALIYVGLAFVSSIFTPITPTVYMAVMAVIFAAMCLIFDRRLKTKGAQLFDRL
ncbi:MAG: hypothetical protein KBS41_05245 [Oscillospiraceae bacterium]|nr:hypothetical protein [Candidatus Equicaccousia limihippi]